MTDLTLKPFNWQNDYGPHWQPGCAAFWLEPDAREIRPGIYPMPFTIRRDLPVYDDENGIWLYEGQEVVAFNYELVHDGHWMILRDRSSVWISDEDLGLSSRRKKRGGYLGRAFYVEEKARRLAERRELRREGQKRQSLLRKLALWPNR